MLGQTTARRHDLDAPARPDVAAWCDTCRPELLRWVIAKYGRRDAEDITQETLARALTGLDFTVAHPVKWAWLLRVANNVAVDLYRERRRCDSAAEPVLVDVRPTTDDDPERVVLEAEEHAKLVRAWSRVTPTQRDLLWLFEVDRLSCETIGLLLGRTEQGIRQGLVRARKRLANEFAKVDGRLGVFAPVVLLGRAVRRTLRTSGRGQAVSAPLAVATAGVLFAGIAGVATWPAIHSGGTTHPRLVLEQKRTATTRPSAPTAGAPHGAAAAVTPARRSAPAVSPIVPAVPGTKMAVHPDHAFSSGRWIDVDATVTAPVVGSVYVEAHLDNSGVNDPVCIAQPGQCR